MSQYQVSQYKKEFGKKKRAAVRKYKIARKAPSFGRVPRNLGPLPITQKATFNYFNAFNLDVGTVGVPASYVFSANGMYDPNITGIGHQPRGFDQLMALYDHYVVVGVKAILTVHASDTGNGAICGMFIKDVPAVSAGDLDIMEQRLITYAPIASETSGPNCATITMNLNPNDYLGRSKPLADPELKGSASNNPAEQCYIHCFCIPAPQGVDTATAYVNLRLEYTAILIEPKQPGSS